MINNDIDSVRLEYIVNKMMADASVTLAPIPFAIAHDLAKWRLLNSSIDIFTYDRALSELTCKLQGVYPASPTNGGFDFTTDFYSTYIGLNSRFIYE